MGTHISIYRWNRFNYIVREEIAISLVSVYDAPLVYGEEEFLAVSPLLAKGVIEEVTFPSSAEIDIQSSWSLVVHNIGTTGRFAALIVNASGNPGDIKLTWEGREWIIPPTDRGLRIYSSAPEPNCMNIRANGQIAFTVAGNYNIRILAQHEGAPDVWIKDDERVKTVNVTGVAPPEWPYTTPVHIFNNLKLKAEWWELGKSRSNSIIDIDTSLLVGGRLDYTVKYIQGTPFSEIAKIAVDGTNMVTESLSKGEAKSGTIDLTGLIGRSATISISFDSAPGFWSEVLFDVWLVLGFSEKPAQPPGGEKWWTVLFDWLDENKYLIALGVIGTGVIIMYRPRAPFLILHPPGKRGR